MSGRCDQATAQEAISLLVRPGEVFEIRALKCHGKRGKPFTSAGWFDDPARAATEVARIDDLYRPDGIYLTLNPVHRDLLSRQVANCMKDYAEGLTTDSDILCRRWLLVDLDPRRRPGISSTNAELEEARRLAVVVRDHLERELGWPEPFRALSGNGCHLLYRVDLPNDEASRDLLKACLHSLIARFSTTAVDIDDAVFNASRICKLYGTIARKGDDTAERPHRLSVFAHPSVQAIVTVEQLKALAAEAQTRASSRKGANSTPSAPSADLHVAIERAGQYLAKIPGAIAGQGGHPQTFSAAVALVRGFALPEDVALELLSRDYNPRCQPPWTEEELRHKIRDAACKSDKHVGYLLEKEVGGPRRTKRSKSRKSDDQVDPSFETPASGPDRPSGDLRPTIDATDKDLKRIVPALEAELLRRCVASTPGSGEGAANLEIFQRSGLLVRIMRDGAPSRGVVRPPNAATIAPIPRGHLRELASISARWTEEKGTGENAEVKPIYPPDAVLAALEDRGTWRFPHLEGIVETPTLRADGSIITTPGYDSPSALFLDTGGASFAAVPEFPTKEDCESALQVLYEPFCDFPFDTETDRAATIAAVLTVAARHLIAGPLPMFAIRARVRGSGKTLISDVISVLWTGRRAARCAHVEDEAEERKRLLAICMAGDQVVLIDNVERPLQSGVLSLALTSREVRERLLGFTRMVTAPMDGVWFVTGNNLVVRGDLSRRIIPIDIDPRVEFPEERAGFKHPNLLQWVTHERPRLVAAALTLLRAYFVAGRPQPAGLAPFGSFEAWSELIRSCVVWLGLPDPIGARDRIRKESDLEAEDLRIALSTWHEVRGSQPWTIPEVIRWISGTVGGPDAEKGEALATALGAFDPKHDGKKLNARRLGHALHKHCGRIIEGLSFVAGEKTREGVPWRVVCDKRDDCDFPTSRSAAEAPSEGPTGGGSGAPKPGSPGTDPLESRSHRESHGAESDGWPEGRE